ncbi:RRM domain-containing protein [Caenorhabditis elegans]|uniref:RRM domain-containing protein n=1 Tax=Caenorhabditis elegans TaxID=6239 RepID=Q95QV6_CAEEL|nr:RRM domain-containing protein [Caenorhabditis elegans]CCD65017.1 RRM domain-containing protein [Caenorhabditis elegans]|eukprot:NP_495122.1 TIA-1/TIAL RNA binding protein homolog [Caenorhabditis elegans]
MSFFNPPANSNHGYNDDVNTGYNARMHSKLAEREGFHLGNGSDEPRTLYVGNLDSTVTEDFIATLFNQIGSVTKTKVIFDELGYLATNAQGGNQSTPTLRQWF